MSRSHHTNSRSTRKTHRDTPDHLLSGTDTDTTRISPLPIPMGTKRKREEGELTVIADVAGSRDFYGASEGGAQSAGSAVSDDSVVSITPVASGKIRSGWNGYEGESSATEDDSYGGFESPASGKVRRFVGFQDDGWENTGDSEMEGWGSSTEVEDEGEDPGGPLDGWDWGSVESASGTGASLGGYATELDGGTAGDEDDWRSVQPASDNESEREEVDFDDWGSVQPASDSESERRKEEEVDFDDKDSAQAASESEREGGLGAKEVDPDDWGSVQADPDEHDEGAVTEDWDGAQAAFDGEEGNIEDGTPKPEFSVGNQAGPGVLSPDSLVVGSDVEETPSSSADEGESDWESQAQGSDSDGRSLTAESEEQSRSTVSEGRPQNLPTPDTSDREPTPKLAERSRFLRSASRQYIASQKKHFTVPIKGRRRGEQVNKFTEGYLELLNSEIRLASDRRIYTTSTSSTRVGSYVMGSFWSKEEKDSFFDHLAALGKDRVDAIARAIGSKSVVECQAYMIALQDGLAETREWVGSRSRDTVGPKEIPAAVELSDECIEALDQQARLLEDRKKRDEERVEKRRWEKFWLMTPVLAQQIDTLYQSADIDGVHDIAPEAELLNVHQMLKLSENLFMNGPGENNFRNMTPNMDPPAIRYSALTDLHDMIIAMTRRLVQTTIFMAESRLRSTESTVFSPEQVVRQADVKTAIVSLDMPLNAWEYWIKMPRRTGVKVVTHLLNMNYKYPETLDIDEVERRLSEIGKKLITRFGSDSLSSSMGNSFGSVDAPARDGEDEETEIEVGDDEAHNLLLPAALRRKAEKIRQQEEKEDKYLEALDIKRSIDAEKDLWRMLGYLGDLDEDDPPSQRDTLAAEHALLINDDWFGSDEDDGVLPKAPRRDVVYEMRSRTVKDWRAGLEYCGPWEGGKRPIEEMDQDGALDHERERSNIPMKRRKVEREGELAVRKASVARSPRQQRMRRQSSVLPGFVPTVDFVELDTDVEEMQAEEGEVRGDENISTSEYEE